ncbi:alpha/beta fold hydrolase [Paractinoplanes atraurantiacus]|uniref:3-oxoadipate enol-lactonase n=1 Tax=Paractinoplanes atraurantiacus TaxID=1036182 RepID=A0A285KKE7_9ACTN|nr:alpha/beta fold hydrolase [Actinoplanes atraurantiacus]SNY73090.1 3-oxoadipate enol-lactonase [Actinoplanes atraurantiacus]
MHALSSRGLKIEYEVTGAPAPAIALLPAWMVTDRRMWRGQVAALGDRFRVVSYDGRGSGGSGRPLDPGAYEPSELVADLLAVLDDARVDRAVLVGNSLGGLVAFLAAALHPDRVAGLVLIGATVDLRGGAPSPLHQAMATFEEPDPAWSAESGWRHYNRHAWQRDYPGFVDWFVATALGAEATPEALALGRSAGLDNTPEVLAATVARRQSDSERLRGLATRVTAPTLVIHGDRDEICPPAWGRELASQVRGARLVELAGAGHCPHVTRSETVAGLIGAFAEVAR